MLQQSIRHAGSSIAPWHLIAPLTARHASTRLAPSSALSRRETLVGAAAAHLSLSTAPNRAIAAMAGGGNGSGKAEQPKDFRYTHMWVSADGETHLKECSMKGFDLKAYAETPQFVKEGPAPSKLVLTELEPGNRQDWHSCPQVQFVVCLSGSWFVETTDGSRKDFQPGEVLFQDDLKDSPASKQPKHYSGVNSDAPNQQLIVQVNRKPEVDNPGSLDKTL